jgi:hypothetical protein
MTEVEWMTCTDPERMLRSLLGKQNFIALVLQQVRRSADLTGPRRASERQLRLYACACCRRIEALMGDDRSRRAIDIAELYADGMADDNEIIAARREALRVAETLAARVGRSNLPLAVQPPVDQADVEIGAARAAVEVTRAPESAIRLVAQAAFLVVVERPDSEWSRWAVEAAGPAAFVALIREVFGNPFRDTAIDPAWLRWNDGTVRKIAQGIYKDRAFDRLPILHDALMDAGCDDETILAHCRDPEGHVRGCWVIDALLGRV